MESYAIKHKGPEFESIESTISFLWVTTQGVFDLQLVAKDNLISLNPLLPESLYDVYGELNPLNLGRLMVITISKAGQKLKRCVQLKALK